MKTQISEQARALGFDVVRFTAADLPPEAALGLQAFLESGHHGQMEWMREKASWRANPKALWPEAQSVIMLGMNYGPDFNPMEKLTQKSTGNISCYALGDDYHDVIKKRLKTLARSIVQQFGGDVKVFVDTAPVMEKPLAEQAGIGWQGKHTCVVSREFGSWLFLGSIFTTHAIDYDPPERDHCGSCRACLDVCPTQAFTAERKLDARKCISYLTIEHQGSIPSEFRKAIGNRIYGCDDCLAVCPWNKYAQTSQQMAFTPRPALTAPKLSELAQLNDAAFRTLFSKSPIKRIGHARFLRNVLIAIGNSEDASLLPIAQRLQNSEDPMVAEAASWAEAELRNAQ
jgi:epoxyqueuosine reductase